jgi:hypothetical protein
MANNITIKDANASDVVVKSIDNASVQLPAHALYDSTGSNAASIDAGGAVKVDGSGATQPVSGNVTANAGTNLNTAALALESGGNLAAAATSLALLDNAISGNEMQVDIVGALPAGTNNIGDVDVLSIIPGTGATNLGKAIDTATGATDTGVLALATRDDALTTLTPADGDNVQLRTTAVGRLWTSAVVDTELPAGTQLIGSAAAASVTGVVYQGTTARTPVFAAIAASSSGNNTIVAAAGASNKIRVLAVQLIANGAVNAKWQSGAGGTDLTGLAYLAANGGYVLPFNPAGWFETAADTLLNLNLSGAVAVGGSLTYIVVT